MTKLWIILSTLSAIATFGVYYFKNKEKSRLIRLEKRILNYEKSLGEALANNDIYYVNACTAELKRLRQEYHNLKGK